MSTHVITMSEVFTRVCSLIDEIGTTYNPVTENTDEYKYRTPMIINILNAELYKYSDTCEFVKGEHPVCPMITKNDWNTILPCDDYINAYILPYGLAAHLIADENPTLAAYFNQRYEEAKAELIKGFALECEEIDDVMGWCNDYYGRFSRLNSSAVCPNWLSDRYKDPY